MANAVEILDAIKAACKIKDNVDTIHLHEPWFDSTEKDILEKCIEQGWASTAGAYVGVFEEKLANYCKSNHVIACTNGTSALHISLLLADVRPGDEVILPAISFVASANSVLYCNASPHFVDVSLNDYGIDADLLSSHLKENTFRKDNQIFNKVTGNRISAMMPVHCFGYPCDIEGLKVIADEFNLPIVEDATEALGTRYKNQQMGTFGDFGALSFNGNKIITTGGGGAILTSNPELAMKATHLTTTAKIPHQWEYFHDQLGYNYRLPSINSALGVAQLSKIDAILNKKKKLHGRYQAVFDTIDDVRLLESKEQADPNHWLNTIIVKNKEQKTQLLELAHSQNIKLRPAWNILPDLPHLNTCYSTDLCSARYLYDVTINIPSSPQLIES